MKNKKGKKLVVLGAMAALLTLIGVSGSQTYAKYIESTTVGSTSATVAKWGFVQNTNIDNLFGKKYGNVSGNIAKVVTTDDGMVVNAVHSAGNVVAPGTSGYMTYSLDGISEVDFRVVFNDDDATISDIALYDGSTEAYLPLEWTLHIVVNSTSSVNETYTGSLSQVLAKLGTYSFNAGVSIDLDITLSWEWAFTSNPRYTTVQKLNGVALDSDGADTMLGILAGTYANANIQYDYDDVYAQFGGTGKSTLQVGFSGLKVTIEQTQNA